MGLSTAASGCRSFTRFQVTEEWGYVDRENHRSAGTGRRGILAPLRDQLRASRLTTIVVNQHLLPFSDQFVEGAAAVDALLSDGKVSVPNFET